MCVTILALLMTWNKYKKLYMFNQCFNLPSGIRPLAMKRKPLLFKVFFFLSNIACPNKCSHLSKFSDSRYIIYTMKSHSPLQMWWFCFFSMTSPIQLYILSPGFVPYQLRWLGKRLGNLNLGSSKSVIIMVIQGKFMFVWKIG